MTTKKTSHHKTTEIFCYKIKRLCEELSGNNHLTQIYRQATGNSLINRIKEGRADNPIIKDDRPLLMKLCKKDGTHNENDEGKYE